MKKLASLLIAASLLTSLAACGGSTGGSSAAPAASDSQAPSASAASPSEAAAPENTAAPSLEGKTITFTMQKYGTDPAAQDRVLKEMTEQFKQETGCTVNYSLIDWGQALTKLTLACTGGEAPDVADAFFTCSIVKMGQGKYGPKDITDIYNELGGDDAFFATAIEEVKFDNRVYGIPWRMDTRPLVYNTEHFEQAGITEPPKTYDEFIEVAKKLTQYDDAGNVTRSGVAFGGQSRFDQLWFVLLAGHGGRTMDESYTRMTFNDAAGEESLQFLHDMIHEYKAITPNVIDPSFDATAEFMAEKASMVIGVNADFKTAVDQQAPQLSGKFAAAIMPNKTGEGVSSIAFAAPICIMQTTKEPEASEAWLKYFCSTENQVKFCTAVNLINSSRAVMQDPAYSEDPWLSMFPLQADRAIQGDGQNPAWSQIDAFPNGPLNTMCTNVVAGQDIKASMDACEQECIKILEENA